MFRCLPHCCRKNAVLQWIRRGPPNGCKFRLLVECALSPNFAAMERTNLYLRDLTRQLGIGSSLASQGRSPPPYRATTNWRLEPLNLSRRNEGQQVQPPNWAQPTDDYVNEDAATENDNVNEDEVSRRQPSGLFASTPISNGSNTRGPPGMASVVASGPGRTLGTVNELPANWERHQATSRVESALEELQSSVRQLLRSLESPTTPTPSSGVSMSCSVCLDSLSQVVNRLHHAVYSTTCGHLFCELCMDRVMLSRRPKCGVCRKRLSMRDYHRIFLN